MASQRYGSGGAVSDGAEKEEERMNLFVSPLTLRHLSSRNYGHDPYTFGGALIMRSPPPSLSLSHVISLHPFRRAYTSCKCGVEIDMRNIVQYEK